MNRVNQHFQSDRWHSNVPDVYESVDSNDSQCPTGHHHSYGLDVRHKLTHEVGKDPKMSLTQPSKKSSLVNYCLLARKLFGKCSTDQFLRHV